MTPRMAAALDWCTACWMASITSPWTPRPVRGGGSPRGGAMGGAGAGWGIKGGRGQIGGRPSALSLPTSSAEVRTGYGSISLDPGDPRVAEREGSQARREDRAVEG